MDESIVKNFDTPTRIKVSEAMRIGKATLKENPYVFYYAGHVCAIGAAIAGLGYSEQDWHAAKPLHRDSGLLTAAALLQLPEALVVDISHKHAHKGMSILQIADWLEGQGY